MQNHRLFKLLVVCLAGCKTPNPASGLQSDDGAGGAADGLAAIIQQDQQTPLTAATMPPNAGVLAKVMAGQSLTDDETKALLDTLYSTLTDCRFDVVDTPLLIQAKTAVHQAAVAKFTQALASYNATGYSHVPFGPALPAWHDFRQDLLHMDCLDVGLAEIWKDAPQIPGRFHYEQRSEIDGFKTFVQTLAWAPNGPVPQDADAQFLQPLASAFEFIDINDILVNMLPDAPVIYPHQPGRQPWQLYDSDGQSVSNLDGWRNAQAQAVQAGTPPLLLFYGAISGQGSAYGFRGKRVVGGGDIDAAGATSWASDTKFYRVSAHQLDVLKSNPFLTVQSFPDPASTPAAPTALAQHEYPSAHTWRRFATYLSADLQAKLQAAEAANQLNDDSTDVFHTLTQSIISELTTYLLNGWPAAAAAGNPASYPEQLLMSVHPAEDFNGRSLRSWYKFYESKATPDAGAAGVPLFLADFDIDLFSAPEEYLEAIVVGQRQWARLLAAFMAERNGWHYYYNIPMPWRIPSGCSALDPSHAGDFLNAAKAWYMVPDNINLVRTKDLLDVMRQLGQAVQTYCH